MVFESAVVKRIMGIPRWPPNIWKNMKEVIRASRCP
jgi:hypothetical protein